MESNVKNRIFINGMSLVAVKKRSLQVWPVGSPLEDREILGFNILARKLKIECDYNRRLIASALSNQGDLISVELHVDNCKFYGSFVAGSLKISKRGFISFDAASSGEVSISAVNGE